MTNCTRQGVCHTADPGNMARTESSVRRMIQAEEHAQDVLVNAQH